MRRKKKIKREITADPKFGNLTVAKFINYVMRKGKKSVARKVVYQTFDLLEGKYKQEPLAVFDAAIKNVGPALEVKSRASDAYGLPEEAVTASKRSRIRRAAEAFLVRAFPKAPPPCRFDVVAVDLDAEGHPLRHRLYKDAFV